MDKTLLLELLKQARHDKEYGGFEFAGVRWASELKDELRLNSAITLFLAARVFGVEGLDKIEGYVVNPTTTITLTPEIALGAAAKMMSHYGNVFAVEAQKKLEAEGLSEDAAEAWVGERLYQGWEQHG